MFCRAPRLVFIAVVTMLCSQSALAGIEIVVSTGDASPDGNGTFAEFANPSLNNAGQIAYLAALDGTTAGETDSIGVFRQSDTNFTQISRSGEYFLNQPIVGFFPFGFFLDANGIVVGNVVSGPPTIVNPFRGSGGPLEVVVEGGTPSPSENNQLLSIFSQGANHAGTFVYSGFYTGTNGESGLYEVAPNGTLTTRLLAGSPAPRGGMLDGVGGASMFNESNQIATKGSVTDGINTFDTLLRVNASSVEEVVRSGDLLDDGITSIRSLGFRGPVINESGAIAFDASYEQLGSFPEGVFVSDEIGTRLIAGGVLPGGTIAARDFEIFGLTENGQVAFTADAHLGLETRTAMYVADSQELTLIAARNQPAPGTDKFIDEIAVSASTINDNGEIAFLADLADSVGGSTSGRALYRYTESSGLVPIIKTGDVLQDSTISELYYAGTLPNSSNWAHDSINGTNDSGQIAFTYILSNGHRGIALWSPDESPGDFNDDGSVTGEDFLIWQRGGSPAPLSSSDLSTWQASYGNNSPSLFSTSVVVPEPNFLVQFAVCGILLLTNRRIATSTITRIDQ